MLSNFSPKALATRNILLLLAATIATEAAAIEDSQQRSTEEKNYNSREKAAKIKTMNQLLAPLLRPQFVLTTDKSENKVCRHFHPVNVNGQVDKRKRSRIEVQAMKLKNGKGDPSFRPASSHPVQGQQAEQLCVCAHFAIFSQNKNPLLRFGDLRSMGLADCLRYATKYTYDNDGGVTVHAMTLCADSYFKDQAHVDLCNPAFNVYDGLLSLDLGSIQNPLLRSAVQLVRQLDRATGEIPAATSSQAPSCQQEACKQRLVNEQLARSIERKNWLCDLLGTLGSWSVYKEGEASRTDTAATETSPVTASTLASLQEQLHEIVTMSEEQCTTFQNDALRLTKDAIDKQRKKLIQENATLQNRLILLAVVLGCTLLVNLYRVVQQLEAKHRAQNPNTLHISVR